MGSDIICDILSQLKQAPENKAFVIEEKSYSYGELGKHIGAVLYLLKERPEQVIGIFVGNNIETYATLLAILLCGKTYVVLHPAYPQERNLKIASLAEIRVAICQNPQECGYLKEAGITLFTPDSNCAESIHQVTYAAPGESFAYIIFTSGSTGEPKGVPISRDNLNAFYRAYDHIGWNLGREDRMLQMFELTFDVSVVSTLYPLALGASVYTVGYKDVKYLKVFDLLEEQKLTFAAIPPSILQLISPFFDEIQLPHLKYLVVTAEASQAELLHKFRLCIPNAEIYNLYGPTEVTIYCTHYRIPHTEHAEQIKQHNGMVAIGKPFYALSVLLADENGVEVPIGTSGEMWIAGPQVMNGYFQALEKSNLALVERGGRVYYKTGDLCIIDENEDLIYCGRKDYQVKIQGFRIELSEIEFAAKQYFRGASNLVVIPAVKAGICSELHLVIEAEYCEKEKLYDYLEQKLPHYMLPKEIHCLSIFPVTASNKIDRKQIAQLISY